MHQAPTDPTGQSLLRSFMRRAAARWLASVLVVALAVSGLLHLPAGGHARAHAHDIVASTADGAVAPCCRDHDAQMPDAECVSAGGCLFCAPVAAPVALLSGRAPAAELRLVTSHGGRQPAPRLRPPERLAVA